jgi:fused signal recognition particle receptor
MADEKKPGFFKRLFGFGKNAEPAPPPAAEQAIDAPPLYDEAAERIAAEIAQAKRAAEAEALRLEAERAESERLALAAAAQKAADEKAEAERAETARRAEAEKRASERAAAERAEAARQQEAELQEAKREAARLQAEKLEAERADAARKAEADRIASAKAAAEKAAADQAEAERQESARQEAARQESARQEAARQESARQEAARQEAARQESARQEAARQEAARQESARQEAERQEAARQEAERQEAARLAAQRREAERVESERAEAERAAAAAAAAAPKASWWQKLKSGLSRTASSVSDGITGLFTKRKLDGETLEELEDLLIQADLGIDVAARISGAVGKGRYDKEIEPDEVRAILAEEVAKVLLPVAQPLVLTPGKKPFVLLMVGVNGSGKTTTIGKLASKFHAEGKSVMLAAGDTFRAAAIEQLKVWGERTGAPVVARDQGGDAAGLAFDAVKAAQEKGVDVLLIDTAGRLQNRTELMAELEKVIRVIRKLDDTAPHATLLVLDATVGQNAISQVDIFGKTAGVTGLVMTKLDGTARGGILVALAEKFKLPIHFIGVGEGVDDLEPFEAVDFARAIAGLEQVGR